MFYFSVLENETFKIKKSSHELNDMFEESKKPEYAKGRWWIIHVDSSSFPEKTTIVMSSEWELLKKKEMHKTFSSIAFSLLAIVAFVVLAMILIRLIV